MSTQAVAQAETALAAARAEAEKQKRDDAKREILSLSAEGAALKAELEPLAAQVTTAQNDRLRITGQLAQARNQINTYAAPLDPLTFPSEQDERERRRKLAAWQAKQRELLAQLEDARLRESVRPQAVALQRRLETLRFAIQNQSAIAEGRRPGQIEGGITTVGEDFLGHTDRRFD